MKTIRWDQQFIDILNSIGVKQHMSGLTHCQNHTLDLIQSHGIEAVKPTPCYRYGRTITSTTKDSFINNLPDLSKFLSISNSSDQLDVTETMDSLFIIAL